MKKAFICYFNDNSAVVVLSEDVHSAVASLDSEQLEKVSRVDTIPYSVL